MKRKDLKKKYYKTWKFWVILLAILIFLYVFGYTAAKNAPPPCSLFL